LYFRRACGLEFADHSRRAAGSIIFIMTLFDRLFRPGKLSAIEKLANTRGTTKGLVKRIDENRELLELLLREAPEFMAARPWVQAWIADNDAFFVQLDEVVRSPRIPEQSDYPRPWPGRDRAAPDLTPKTHPHLIAS